MRDDAEVAAASRLAVWIRGSVISDAEGMVPTGGERTRFEAVGERGTVCHLTCLGPFARCLHMHRIPALDCRRAVLVA
jgi:hypothetical protein